MCGRSRNVEWVRGVLVSGGLIEHDASGVCVVSLRGDVDIARVPDIRKAISRELDDGTIAVVLDLSAVDYADSSALGMMLWIDSVVAPRGGRVVLAGANEHISRTLELTGLASVARSLTVSGDVESALSKFAPTPVDDQPDQVRDFSVEADVAKLGSARDRVCAALSDVGFTDAILYDIRVAVGEALANAVIHGSKTVADRVDVSVSRYPDRVMIEVTDSGEGFDDLMVGAPGGLSLSGRGVSFMRRLVDRVDFLASPSGGTVVRLTQHRPAAG